MIQQLTKNEKRLLYVNGKYVVFPAVIYGIGCHIIFNGFFNSTVDEPIGYDFLIGGMIFILVGLIWFYINYYNGRYKIYLIEQGVVSFASLIKKEVTLNKVNMRRVYKLIYEFRPANGYRYKVSQKTIYPEDYNLGSKIDVIYIEKNPRRNLIVMDLPSHVASFVRRRGVEKI